MNASSSQLKFPEGMGPLLKALVVAGTLAFVVSLFRAPARAWADLLIVSYLLLQISLAGIFFVALQYVTGAAWSVGLRRIPETMALLLPLGAAGMAVILIFHPQVYSWASTMPGEPLAGFKRVWLDLAFFRARSAVYLGSWLIFVAAIVRRSRRQDTDGDILHTRRNVRLSGGFLVVLALTLIPASFDWMMSLEPRWSSTVFAFYDFAGLFVGGLAALVLLAAAVERLAPGKFTLTDLHRYDLGKLLFAFSTFWGYLWFCQYMLIWYANVSDEARFYVHRTQGAWGKLFLLNLLLNWTIPFLVLLQRRAKETTRVLVAVALVILAGRTLDLYLLIYPAAVGYGPVFGPYEFGMISGAAALFALMFARVANQAPLVPCRDPYLLEQLHTPQ